MDSQFNFYSALFNAIRLYSTLFGFIQLYSCIFFEKLTESNLKYHNTSVKTIQ